MKNVFISLLVFTVSLYGDTLLKETDIRKVMQEILSQHVDKKEISGSILKTSLKNFIEDFDPDRIYLLEGEISYYLNPDSRELEEVLNDYKGGNFSLYEELNKVFQKSILRARQFRSGQNLSLWFDQALSQKLPYINTAGYARTVQELALREELNFKEEVQEFVHKYGRAGVVNQKSALIDKYVEKAKLREDPYLYVNLDGRPLDREMGENLFSLHVLKALASSLDSHTRIYDPKEAYSMKVRLEKEYEGVGISLAQRQGQFVVKEVLKGSPADLSHQVMPQDIVVEVNGRKLQGADVSEAMDIIRAPNQATVNLVLQRGGDFIRITLPKKMLAVQEGRAQSTSFKYENGIIGVIKLDSFYQSDDGLSAEQDVRAQIENLEKENLKGLVLDLRNNSGGFLIQAVKVAGLFISNGVVVISKYSSGDEKIYRDIEGKEAFKGPLIVLVSRMTASAAEIVAEALQDYGVALIVGDEHTYGKGTIQSQTVTEKNSGSSYFKVTVGKYYTVSGNTPQIQGVKSDIVVPGPLEDQQIGEEFLEHSLKPDKIKPEYDDDLKDVDPKLKDWYLKYYMPTLQHKVVEWRNFIPQLRQASQLRIINSRPYQLLLQDERGDPIRGPLPKESLSDLQLQEAVSIVKDMISLEQTKGKGG